jgi:hypothetical protein
MAIDQKAKATIHFMDGTKMTVTYPRLNGKNSMAIASSIGKAIEADKLAIATSSKLVIIPTCNIKLIEVSPGPDSLPSSVISGAEIS